MERALFAAPLVVAFLAAALAGDLAADPSPDATVTPFLAAPLFAGACVAGALAPAALPAAALAVAFAPGARSDCYVVWSSTVASAATFWTARMPAMADAFESYASLVATTWPLAERSEKRNFPVLPFFTTNFAGKDVPLLLEGAGPPSSRETAPGRRILGHDVVTRRYLASMKEYVP